MFIPHYIYGRWYPYANVLTAVRHTLIVCMKEGTNCDLLLQVQSVYRESVT